MCIQSRVNPAEIHCKTTRCQTEKRIKRVTQFRRFEFVLTGYSLQFLLYRDQVFDRTVRSS
jgi:hypothetical protein